MADEMTTNPTNRIEEKLDDLAKAVSAGFAAVDGRLTKVEGKLATLEGEVTAIGRRLTKIEVYAENTDALCKNIWDSQTSLERRMIESFAEAGKERKENYRLLSSAVQSWGERVGKLEEKRANGSAPA